MTAHGNPTAAELVAAVAEFLESDVRGATDGKVNFHALVAANVLRIIERELRSDADPAVTLRHLGFTDETQLAAAIRDGRLDERGADVTAALRTLVRHRLAVNHPGYEIASIADQLFAAVEDGDVDALAAMCSEGVAFWHIGDDRIRPKSRGLNVVKWFIAATADRHYDVVDRQLFDGGFVQQQVLHGTTREGTPYTMRLSVIVRLGDGGLITRVDAYFDPAALSPLRNRPK